MSSFYPKDNRLSVNHGRHFYRFKPALQYAHIHHLFSKTIDRNLIETMLPEMLPVTETEYPETQALIQVYRVGQLSPFDHTYHLTIGGTYELPFGRNKMFNFGGSRLMDELLGGFVLNAIYQFQTGPPIFFSAERDR